MRNYKTIKEWENNAVRPLSLKLNTIKEWENNAVRPLSLKLNTMSASKNNATLKYQTLSEWCIEQDKKQNNK